MDRQLCIENSQIQRPGKGCLTVFGLREKNIDQLNGGLWVPIFFGKKGGENPLHDVSDPKCGVCSTTGVE